MNIEEYFVDEVDEDLITTINYELDMTKGEFAYFVNNHIEQVISDALGYHTKYYSHQCSYHLNNPFHHKDDIILIGSINLSPKITDEFDYDSADIDFASYSTTFSVQTNKFDSLEFYAITQFNQFDSNLQYIDDQDKLVTFRFSNRKMYEEARAYVIKSRVPEKQNHIQKRLKI
ncbi:hypothetical protein SIO92_002883 [Burkholderia cenocepacia]|nr:hypothetical protein [Burkholderia cenocepacia]